MDPAEWTSTLTEQEFRAVVFNLRDECVNIPLPKKEKAPFFLTWYESKTLNAAIKNENKRQNKVMKKFISRINELVDQHDFLEAEVTSLKK